jgi:NADPH-dependent 2,4-dienoyl-CoA reductase/sulfur reductase-like enzyme
MVDRLFFLQIGVDTETKEVKLSTGDALKFDYLILATGGRPRTMAIPGSGTLFQRLVPHCKEVTSYKHGKFKTGQSDFN